MLSRQQAAKAADLYRRVLVLANRRRPSPTSGWANWPWRVRSWRPRRIAWSVPDNCNPNCRDCTLVWLDWPAATGTRPGCANAWSSELEAEGQPPSRSSCWRRMLVDAWTGARDDPVAESVAFGRRRSLIGNDRHYADALLCRGLGRLAERVLATRRGRLSPLPQARSPPAFRRYDAADRDAYAPGPKPAKPGAGSAADWPSGPTTAVSGNCVASSAADAGSPASRAGLVAEVNSILSARPIQPAAF